MKRTVLIILAVCFTVSGIFTGCGNSRTAQSPEVEMRIVKDSAGREVELPVSVESIVPLGNTPRMITYLGLSDKVVGLGGMDAEKISPLTAYAYANKERWGKLPLVGTDACGATDYYPEEIIRVNPDVILCSYTAELADEIQKKTGIPVVAVPMGDLFGKSYEDALRLLGDVCGASARAEEVIGFINDSLRDLNERTAGIPVSEKPTALAAAATFKGAHGIEGVYSKYAVFTAIAANDVTAGVSDHKGGFLVDKEQIIGWNPEYIFLDSGGVGLVRADYAENPEFYSHLTAVEENRVYQYPSSTSYYSNVEIPIVNCYYAGSILFPQKFDDIEFKRKAGEIFGFFLGDEKYLEKLEKAGAGYGKVILGDR